MRWRAFLANGTQITSAVSTWSALPREGVVIAVWWDAAGRRHLECGADALVMAGDRIVSVNLPTARLAEAANDEALEGRLKYGILLDPVTWADIRAVADAARTPPEG